jgi:hypothetical protein
MEIEPFLVSLDPVEGFWPLFLVRLLCMRRGFAPFIHCSAASYRLHEDYIIPGEHRCESASAAECHHIGQGIQDNHSGSNVIPLFVKETV